MVRIVSNPDRQQWAELLSRPALDARSLWDRVEEIIEQVRTQGDKALIDYAARFDHASLTSVEVSATEWESCESLLDEELMQAIRIAHKNIECFHAAQRFEPIVVETMSGVKCWQKSLPIEKVGLYVPGGTAPLFSTVLMLATPARIAGCKEIVLCTPPDTNGAIHPAILFAAKVAGVGKVFKAGGAQAIAAMSYGTESIPQVYKIFGPGNQYVTAAKQLSSLKQVAIDMPAGPSEVAIIADETANPIFIAADFLSQAEHGADSQSVLFTWSNELADRVVKEIDRQLCDLSRKGLAESSLGHSTIFVLHDETEAVEMSNEYAPEHLIIQTKNYSDIADRITQAGSIFLGAYTPESAGDYASGTNHTLPTNGYARSYSGVNLDSFCKKITYQELTPQGLSELGETIEIMAANELLDAHKNAVTVRLSEIKKG